MMLCTLAVPYMATAESSLWHNVRRAKQFAQTCLVLYGLYDSHGVELLAGC